MNHHAWLQKHASPAATGGEFHWYPEVGDRELRAAFVERVRGVEPPAVLWQLEPGRVAWGQVFSAIAPRDGRRYVGLVVSLVEADRSAAELLARVSPPPAAPWEPSLATEFAEGEPTARLLATVARVARGDVPGVVRALLSGGAAQVDDPTSPELPAWLASIERTLPDPDSTTRTGVLRSATASRAPDRVAALAAAAWAEPGSRSAAAWTVLCELALARCEPVDRIGDALDAGELDTVLTGGERAALGGCDRVVDVLHAWGRGRLAGSPAADTLVARLADLVALRALSRLAAGGAASEAIAEARWHALLPAGRRGALLSELARRVPSLRGCVHDQPGKATTPPRGRPRSARGDAELLEDHDG